MLRHGRILIVDDSQLTRKIIRRMLEGHELINIDEAASGSEAMKLLLEITYSLVISDWDMAPMTGLDLLAKMRTIARTARIPFIMATAKAQKKYASVARDNGATHYLEKPFSADRLMECVRAT